MKVLKTTAALRASKESFVRNISSIQREMDRETLGLMLLPLSPPLLLGKGIMVEHFAPSTHKRPWLYMPLSSRNHFNVGHPTYAALL